MHVRALFSVINRSAASVFLTGVIFIGFLAWTAAPAAGAASADLVSAATEYVRGMAAGDRVAVGRLDFACQFRLVSERGPSASRNGDQGLYDRCWASIEQVNNEPVVREDLGVHGLWPGRSKTVFFGEDFGRYHYAPSAFVSNRVGDPRSGTQLSIEHVKSEPVPPASFRLSVNADMVGAPATAVYLRIHYANPITSPVSYAAGTYQWANPVKRPQAVLKAVTLKWIVLSDLKRAGFPRDIAVLNLPVVPATDKRPAVPFLMEYSEMTEETAEWWAPEDAPRALTAALKHATTLPKLMDRVALYNRILIIDDDHLEALTGLTRDLFDGILHKGLTAQNLQLENRGLASRVSELYWDTYAQTERMDISLGMEMGGYDEPTAADYMFRMIPAMERLAELRPDDLQNLIRLGTAYRWNLDQLKAIETHAAVVDIVPPEQRDLRARALTELAWSKITKVAFNRMLDDPAIKEAYRDSGRAYEVATDPIGKFAAAYTMAYSLVFTPDRDNRVILRHLSDAKSWYLKVPGGTEQSWRILLGNETMKAVIDADPSLQHLVAAGDKG